MKISLEHIPKERQSELKAIANKIAELIKPEKIILFGSYATGKQITDKYVSGGITYEYMSDFDLLVVTTKGEKREEHQLQELLESNCQPLTAIPINIIVHGIEYVNKRIAEGQYFFADIRKEGIVLYDASNIALAEPKILSPEEKKKIAEKDFIFWFSDAKGFLASAQFHLGRKELNLAAFQLHQAAERTYNTMIIVFTGYKPKTHNISKLAKMSSEFSPELSIIFPNNIPSEIHLFTLLKKAYIDARYKENFLITENELNTLIHRIKKLQGIAEKICWDKITSLK